MSAQSRRPTFRIEKRAFLQLWANNIQTSSDWKSFIANCWDRFAPDNMNRDDNPFVFTIKDIKSNRDAQYSFLSERVYQKCSKIRKEMKEAGFEQPNYPAGYLERKGKKTNARLSAKDMNDIFNPE